MGKGPFKMTGYTYPGTSPITKDTIKDPDYKDTGEGEGGTTFGKIDFTQDERIVRLINAGAPSDVINKKIIELKEEYKNKNIKK